MVRHIDDGSDYDLNKHEERIHERSMVRWLFAALCVIVAGCSYSCDMTDGTRARATAAEQLLQECRSTRAR